MIGNKKKKIYILHVLIKKERLQTNAHDKDGTKLHELHVSVANVT